MMAARAVTAQPGTRSCAATLSLGFVKYLVRCLVVVVRFIARVHQARRGERLKR